MLDPGFLKGKSVAIFSGTGNPDGFQNCVCGLGIKVARSFRFADHYNYTQADIWRMVQEARDNNLEAIITTDKDAVKIRGLTTLGMEILVLEIKLKITKNEAEFDRRLLKLYSF
jgi:tetraacyldisaccharide 4'-kinase